MRTLIASVAAIAMATSAAYAQPDKGKGQGNGKNKGQSAQVERGGGQNMGNGNAKRGGPDKVQGKQAQGKKDRGPDKVQRANYDRGSQGPGKVNRGNGNGKSDYRGDRGQGNGQGQGNANRGRDYYDDDYRGRRDRDGGLLDRAARLPYASNRGLIDGCPPGLRKKNPPCVPPGQAKKQGYYGSGYYRPSLFGLGGLRDGRYYYNDGYLMRMGSNNLVNAFIPLLGGALGIGNTWPSYYQAAPVPNYYQSYYGLEPRGYRYADNVLYRVDPETAAITSVAALLTGDDIRVGQPMPAGYGVYNVPYSYRDRYYDRPDAHYRYSDGYVYQVDPETRLVAAAIELLI